MESCFLALCVCDWPINYPTFNCFHTQKNSIFLNGLVELYHIVNCSECIHLLFRSLTFFVIFGFIFIFCSLLANTLSALTPLMNLNSIISFDSNSKDFLHSIHHFNRNRSPSVSLDAISWKQKLQQVLVRA